MLIMNLDLLKGIAMYLGILLLEVSWIKSVLESEDVTLVVLGCYDRTRKHTYITRYGTEENIYEEISDIERARRSKQHSMLSLSQSLVEEEVRRVKSSNKRILGELNLSVSPKTTSSSFPNHLTPSENLTKLSKVPLNSSEDFRIF